PFQSKKPTGYSGEPSRPLPRDSRALRAFSVPGARAGSGRLRAEVSAFLLGSETARRGARPIYRVDAQIPDIYSGRPLARRVRLRYRADIARQRSRPMPGGFFTREDRP